MIVSLLTNSHQRILPLKTIITDLVAGSINKFPGMINNILLMDAEPAELEKAAAENHRQLFSLNAECMGGNVIRSEGLEWTFISGQQASIVMFPSLRDQTASTLFDHLMEQYRDNPPESAGYWSLAPVIPPDTGLKLLARGWQTGWQPCWMAMDAKHHPTSYLLPENIRIIADNDISIVNIKDLPYADDGAYMSSSLLKRYPEKAQRFVALMDNEVIGHCVLFFSHGECGVAGLYCVGVLPAYRRKGIGNALVLAACAFARQKGFRYVILNANHLGRPVYEKAGFRFISYGITWWLMGRRYITNPPGENEIKLAEAIGTGDLDALNNLAARFTAEKLNQPMCNGMRWIELAVYYRQEASVLWLIDQGASCTALDAWDLGWKDRVTEMLRADPEEVNRRYFEWGATLAHIAAEKNDIELLSVLLSAAPDLSLQDLQHHATALDWAHFFHRTEQIALITKYISASGSSSVEKR